MPKPVERGAGPVQELPGEGWVLREFPGEWVVRQLPEEWVLRQLADSDLDDAAVMTLLSAYGGVPPGRYFFESWVPDDVKLAPGDLLYGLAIEDRTTVEDARWWLKTARALAGVWARASRGEDPADAWSAEGFWEEPELPRETACWDRFAHALSIGLRPFQATVEHVDASGKAHPVGGTVDLYSAACLQVFNLIVGECNAVRCENETCEHVFAHQLGGSQFGQHRSKGLRFCTPECARAQTQRAYRRRRKAAAKSKEDT
jgi:hypothetical protein